MNNFFYVSELATLARLRRVVVILAVGLFVLLLTTACSPADTTAGPTGVPEATAADVNRAQGNLSDDAVNVDNLSRQSPQARTGGTGIK